MKTKNFSKSGVSLSLPPLHTIQKDSWKWFWESGLKELFFEVSPIRDYTGEELELWFLDYKLEKSKYANDLEAKKNNDSYEAPLRVKVKLVNLKTKETREQEVFLTDFPLMTERGTFVVNGVERVVISQLIRSPGVFFTAKKSAGRKLFGAKIIPNRGAWLELETEPSGFIGVKVDRKRKMAATTLLKAFLGEKAVEQGGKTQKENTKTDNDEEQHRQKDKEIMKLFKDVDTGKIKYIKETLNRDSAKNSSDAWVEIYRRLRPGEMATPDTARDLIINMFCNFERYDLSKVGRWKTNQRLGINYSKQKHEKAQPEIINVSDRILKPDDILETLREIVRLNNNEEAEADQIDHLGNRRVRTISELLQNRLRVGLMRMERIIKDRMSTLDVGLANPTQIINPRPFMAVVKEFFSSFQLSQFMDNENPLAELEHKRRLSATGPGGLTRERAGFEVRDVQPSHYGRICPIQTPEGANIGLVGHLASYARINSYGFIETPYFVVKNGRVTSEVRYLNAYEEEKYNIAHGGVEISKESRIVPEKVEARIKSKPGLIDRAKIDFIDVSSEQFISVATSLIPFLQNDDANRALMGSNMQRQSVPLLRAEPPLVMTGIEEFAARDSGEALIAREDGVIAEVDAQKIEVRTKKSGRQRYQLNNFIRTNQYTCLHQRSRVKKGQKVKKGEILTDSSGIVDGYLSLGRNVLVAFMSFRGRNYEDAIIISERLVRDDVFSSIHIENFTCDVRDTKLGPEVTTCDIPNIGEEKLKDLDEEGIVRIGATVGTKDILIGKISPKGEADMTAEERLLKAIFGEKAKEIKDTSLYMRHGKQGRVVNVRTFSRELGHRLEPGVTRRIKVDVAQLRKIKAGDKLAGRHGNKGVISKILPEEDMPFMEDGTPIDIILNPLSVTSRMNIGQVLEAHLGYAAEKLGYRAITRSLAGATEKDIKKELKEAGFPESGKIKLFDGMTGDSLPEPITVGYVYIMKLVHMVEDKIHMRSIGPYSLITQQPLGGKAQFGGQRFGEMEVWALEGYGAAYNLQEMLTIKSDDVPGRAATYEAILKGEPIKSPNVPASFNLLLNELRALGLNVEVKVKEREKRS